MSAAAPWQRRETIVPLAVALLCAAVLTACTLWAAKPVYAPLRAEFGWQPLALGLALALSLAVTAAGLRPLDRLHAVATGRAWASGGLLGCVLVVLLLLPTLTHLWQLIGALGLLGLARAATLLGLWRTLRCWLSRRTATVLLLGAAVLGLWPASAVIGETVYRNSWREGVAAAAGLLLLATPFAYVLLPGREALATLDPPPATAHDGGQQTSTEARRTDP